MKSGFNDWLFNGKGWLFLGACVSFLASLLFEIGSPHLRQSNWVDENGNWNTNVKVEASLPFVNKEKDVFYQDIKALKRQSIYTFYSQTCAYLSFAFLLLLVVVQDLQINTLRKNFPPRVQ